MKCRICGQELGEDVKICPICRAHQIEGPNESISQENDDITQLNNVKMDDAETSFIMETEIKKQKSRLVAGLLQLFFGGFGLGRFYLGYTGIAVGQLFTLPLLGVGYIWGFIDGILILCGQLDLDAEGIPLK